MSTGEEWPLRVLVNLSWLVPGVVGGSEDSTTGALTAVLDNHPEVEMHLAVLRPFLSAHPDLAERCMCEVLDLSGTGKVARVLAEQTWLARRTTELSPDLVHHAGGVVPLRHPGRSALTIHDLQPLDLPGNFSAAKRAYLRFMLERSAGAAELVCVPSEFTALRVVDLLEVPRDSIAVVPWTVGSSPATIATAAPDSGHPLFLYPAITYPHKNHLVLLDAFSDLLRAIPGARLVLPGGVGPSEGEVQARIARSDLAGKVERPGRVERSVLEDLYREATAVVVPSRYEGFGLPALEAMARGVPVLVADAGALPEVVAHGAGVADTPVDPDDVTAWSEAMQAVARLDVDRRRLLVEVGISQAAEFEPSRTADALVAAWRRAAVMP